MAKKLKEAGLQHQIVIGDWHLAWLPKDKTYASCPSLFDCVSAGPYEEDIWLPTLPDLLEWLEGREYKYTISFFETVKGLKPFIRIWKPENIIGDTNAFYADTPEDAVAKAVLGVLEQEGKDG
jgi:hypothetical protein